ncbi:copper-translocating P-type ATPase [Trichococcus ilyis]|uniref:P-type Cu(+) transporter n=1 Tax=Trichococcus ilyis TaxID=640938 RepID=A0A143Z854_9LACT|nr:copper-translocating P-type ATPase [Trichococcus ilyis]CZR09689.1 p-type atpase phosphorylation site [Trichococcus ilyis]SEJ89366.1 Cu2+-exporting ATPase [Trichococcus ilyis]
MDEHDHTQHKHTVDATPNVTEASHLHSDEIHTGHEQHAHHAHMTHDHASHQEPVPHAPENVAAKPPAAHPHEHEHGTAPAQDHGKMDHENMEPASGHAGHHEHMVADFRKRFWVTLGLTIPVTLLSPMIMMLFGFHLDFPGANIVVFVLSTIIFFYGGKPFLKGAMDEWKQRSPGMMLLISLAIVSAYIYSTFTAFFITGSDFYFELATLILIMLLGHWIEMKSQMGASKALEELIKLMPKVAHKLDSAGNSSEVSVEELVPGDRILIKPGEKIPLDGKIFEGSSTVDESMLTGESVPVEKQPGMAAIGGSINGNGVLKVTVEKVGNETYLAQVIQMVTNAQQQKSKAQGLADKAAKWLFYIAVTAGILTFGYWLLAADLPFALERMVTVLVIACPHALGLAVPLVNAVSTSIAARNGLLIRNRTQFEEARKIDRIVFDKTGTLTEGNFGVTDIVPAEGIAEKDLLTLAYSVELQSEHPIAKGIVRKGEADQLTPLEVKDYQNLTGQGLQALVNGVLVAIVSPGTMDERALAYYRSKYAELAQQGKTVVFVLKEDRLQGMIAIADMIRDSSYAVIAALKEQEIESFMLTGDNSRVADYVGKKLGMAQVFAEVLPAEKSKHIVALKEGSKKVAMVGDGVNDAPALAQADLGIAIGAGTDVAIETADVILVDSDPQDVLTIIRLSKATYRKMVENLIWAVGYNVIAIPLAAGVLNNQGIVITPAIGAAVMSISTIICAVNARLLKID